VAEIQLSFYYTNSVGTGEVFAQEFQNIFKKEGRVRHVELNTM
jgi:hypothetical protein